jgi:hypothetical protein
VLKRLGGRQFPRDSIKPARNLVEDAYLLVLLADQEVGAGRVAQAQILVDAAYAAFDRKFRVE